MTSRDFCFWLQGYFEINGENNEGMSVFKLNTVRRHLELVFKHEIDPSMPDKTGELQSIHDGKPNPIYGSVTENGQVLRC